MDAAGKRARTAAGPVTAGRPASAAAEAADDSLASTLSPGCSTSRRMASANASSRVAATARRSGRAPYSCVHRISYSQRTLLQALVHRIQQIYDDRMQYAAN